MSKSLITYEGGELIVITGPVMAGKTTETLKQLFREASIGMKCLYVNHKNDDRSTSGFSTHNPLYKEKLSELSNVTLISVDSLSDIIDIPMYDVIAIDEMQFFNEADVKYILFLVDMYGKKVIVSGITLDFERNPFDVIMKLSSQADEVILLSALCKECSTPQRRSKALFSYRISDSSERILIGGKEDYIPLCRSCYMKKSRDKEIKKLGDNSKNIDKNNSDEIINTINTKDTRDGIYLRIIKNKDNLIKLYQGLWMGPNNNPRYSITDELSNYITNITNLIDIDIKLLEHK